MVDILCLENGVYKAYEVKSSIKISEVYLKDACLQYYVLKNTLANFDDLFLVTLNADYILEDTINPKFLFKKRSVKKLAEENLHFFNAKINDAHLLLEENKIPNISIGKHCFKPYTCDFFGSCWKDVITENSIFNLPRIGKDKLFEWFNEGIREVEQISEMQIVNEINIDLKNAFIQKNAIINKPAITEFLQSIQTPYLTMDMEIWATAIPQLQNTKPFEQIPFLACFYDGKNHLYYITEHVLDDRYNFALALIANTKNYNSILVYDKTMEVLAINKLIELYPNLKMELDEVLTKIIDVYPVIANFDYYHTSFKTNFSLKAVSEVLLPTITYTTIQSGLQAMAYFESFRITEDLIEKETLKQNLIDYCQTDTLAVFELVEFLKLI
jgi:predicted RecB family nuclease